MSVFTTLNQATGRDRIVRFIQYLCRTLSYLNEGEEDNFRTLEGTFSTFRKLLRFGRSIESFHIASKLVDDNDIIKRLSGLSKVANGCYLLCDHIETLGRLKLTNVNIKEWNFTANKFWLLTDVLNLVQNYCLLKKYYAIYKSNPEISPKKKIKYLLPIYLDVIRNLSDIFLPLYVLKVVNINSGLSGFFGMISSLLSLLLLFFPMSLSVKL